MQDNQPYPETEWQSLKDGAGKPSEDQSGKKKHASVAAAEQMTSFMGIMDFVQPDAADDIFAEMGISRAAPVPIPPPVVQSKPSEPPKV